MHKDYFEAIIQLRPRKQDLLDFVRIESIKSNTNISKVISKDFGFDVYLSSRKSAIQISKKLKKKFNGNLIISKTLYSRDNLTSKLIYRITILFRLN